MAERAIAAPAPIHPVHGAAAALSTRAASALVVAAVALAYATAFRGGFQFDDFRVVVSDPRVQSLGAWMRSMPGIRPLLKLTYAANHASGLGLLGFHLVNVAVHASSAVLVLRLLTRLEHRLAPAPLPRSPPPEARAPGRASNPARTTPAAFTPDQRAAPPAALLGALVFALHPVQTEAVTYVSGRSSSLAAALALASLLTHLRALGRPTRLLPRLAAPFLLGCSLLVKESAFVLPAALLLVAATGAPRPRSWRAALRDVGPELAVVTIATAALLASPVYRQLLAQSLALRGLADNLATHLSALAWLAGQFVRLGGSNADPGLTTVAGVTALAALALLAGLVAVVAAGAAQLRHHPRAAFALLWALLWTAPQGLWLPRPEPASERQLYLALAGPAWLAGWWLARLGTRPVGRVAVVALLLVVATFTGVRNMVYVDEVRFWSDVVRKSPRSGRARLNLGHALALDCRPAEAELELRRAIALDPSDFTAGADLRLLREGALLGPEERGRCEGR